MSERLGVTSGEAEPWSDEEFRLDSETWNKAEPWADAEPWTEEDPWLDSELWAEDFGETIPMESLGRLGIAIP